LEKRRSFLVTSITEDEIFAGHAEDGKDVDVEGLQLSVTLEAVRERLNDGLANAIFRSLRAVIHERGDEEQQGKKSDGEKEQPLPRKARGPQHEKSLANKAMLALWETDSDRRRTLALAILPSWVHLWWTQTRATDQSAMDWADDLE
jgi:hypothetical protein